MRDDRGHAGAQRAVSGSLIRPNRTISDAIKVEPVDTTGAGDTFTGYVVAGLDRGMPMADAIDLAHKRCADGDAPRHSGCDPGSQRNPGSRFST